MSEHRKNARITHIDLDETSIAQRNELVARERAITICDLVANNLFLPYPNAKTEQTWQGPFRLYLHSKDHQLLFTISNHKKEELGCIALSLSPFRAIVRDYFQICESYYDAVKKHSPMQIETIDAARRGLHDEGADLLIEQLQDKIETDKPTARRLFTLIALLYLRL